MWLLLIRLFACKKQIQLPSTEAWSEMWGFFVVQKTSVFTEFSDTFAFNYLSLVTPLVFCSMSIQIKTLSHPAVPLIVIPSIYL